jgi:hypothetical protein
VILNCLLIWLFAGTTGGPQGLLELAMAQGIHAHTSETQSVFLYSFTRGGERRDTLVLTAGAAFQIEVPNPDARPCVSLLAAMPFNLGDGAILGISTEANGERVQLFQRKIDPAHQRADRDWLPLRLDVPSTANPILLRFAVEAGIHQDFTGDWIGLTAGPDQECLFSARATRH